MIGVKIHICQIFVTGIETLNNSNDAFPLFPQVDDESMVQNDKAMVEWESRRPRPRTAHVGPFRDTALEAPIEARLQPTYHDPQSYVDQTVNRSAVFTPVSLICFLNQLLTN